MFIGTDQTIKLDNILNRIEKELKSKNNIMVKIRKDTQEYELYVDYES